MLFSETRRAKGGHSKVQRSDKIDEGEEDVIKRRQSMSLYSKSSERERQRERKSTLR